MAPAGEEVAVTHAIDVGLRRRPASAAPAADATVTA